MVESALDFLNGEDLPSLPVAVQAESLKVWSRLEAKRAAAEARLIAAFGACDGPAADGQKSMAAWLTRFARCTKPAAKGMVAASYRARERRHIAAALTEGAISESYGRWISDVTRRFDEADRDAVEQILVEAAAGGGLIEDLEQIAITALRRLQPGRQVHDEARTHADRGLTLAKTFGGVGRLNGDLDAEATALTEQAIEALAVKQGPEDDRTARQRRHDALAEAFRRLIGSDLLPERGGSKPHIKVDIDLAALLRLPGGAEAADSWVRQQRAALTRARVSNEDPRDLLVDPTPADGYPAGTGPIGLVQQPLPGLTEGAALAGVGPISDGLAGALACDSTLTPTVVGAVDHDALTQMTDVWLRAHGMCSRLADDSDAGCGCDLRHGLSAATHLRLRETLLSWAVKVLSGPGGLASYLRTGLMTGPLAGPSIVLDVGRDDKTVPAPLDRAIRRRDRRCRFPGCDQPAELSQVHHIQPRSEGGPTALWNMIVLCSMHHLTAVHTWGWTIRLNLDGTTTATGPDGRVLHENDPPGDPPLRAA